MYVCVCECMLCACLLVVATKVYIGKLWGGVGRVATEVNYQQNSYLTLIGVMHSNYCQITLYVHVRVYVRVCVCVCGVVCMWECVCVCMCACVHVYIHESECVCMISN